MNKTIILIHGLYANSIVMKPLEIKFKKKGFSVYQFEYNTVAFKKEDVLKNLHNLINTIHSNDISIIGHSMGGLVARLYQNKFMSTKVKSIVTLATPHNGSHVAKYISKTKFNFLLGNCGESGIITDIEPWKKCSALGCIIAISDFGINSILSKLHGKIGKNDGNVFVDEAYLSNATDNVIIKSSHTGILISNIAFKHCIEFIENNHF